MRRVVVTGLGLVSPLGNDVATSWNALLDGACGIDRVTLFDVDNYGCQIGGEVKNFDAAQYLPAKEARRFDRFIAFGCAAGMEALFEQGDPAAERAGVILSAGIGGLDMLCKNYGTLLERGPRRVSPFMIPGSIINLAGGELSILRNLKGPNLTTVTACASGLHAIGEASWIIRRGDADVMVAGGCEGSICPDGIAGFDVMHALSRRNDDPKHASRPFDTGRDGFVMGEGAGVLVLEEYEHAKARGAKIYCEIAGYGLSGDAGHITTPSTDGPVRSMKMALGHAEMKPEDVMYVNAHGTSTPIGDINECKAIREVFGEHTEHMWVSSTKGATGHLLGGAGGLESVFTVKAIETDTVPPTINLENQDPECKVRVCAGKPEKTVINAAMKNNFGFGGTNATVIFKKLK